MKTINCTAKLLPDGHLLLPPDVLKKIKKKECCASNNNLKYRYSKKGVVTILRKMER